MTKRRKSEPPAAPLEIMADCKEYVIDYLAKSFPVRLMAVFTDENGNPRSEPMSDEQGAPVLCRSALAARDRMIEQLCALPPIATALDAIIERFGVDQVAEVTGRTRRLIIRPRWSAEAAIPVAARQRGRDPGIHGRRQAHPGLFRCRWHGAQLPCRPGGEEPGTPRPLSCSSRAGGPMPQSRGLAAPIAPTRLRPRCSGR
jgi:hypothetical protein